MSKPPPAPGATATALEMPCSESRFDRAVCRSAGVRLNFSGPVESVPKRSANVSLVSVAPPVMSRCWTSPVVLGTPATTSLTRSIPLVSFKVWRLTALVERTLSVSPPLPPETETIAVGVWMKRRTCSWRTAGSLPAPVPRRLSPPIEKTLPPCPSFTFTAWMASNSIRSSPAAPEAAKVAASG